MEAVIGHLRHSDQCHRYYRDSRNPSPRRQAKPGPKGSCKGGKAGHFHSLLWLHKSLWTTAYSRVHRHLGVQHGSTFSPSTSLTLSRRRTRLSVSGHLSPCLIIEAPFAPFVMLPQWCQRVILCPIYSKNPVV